MFKFVFILVAVVTIGLMGFIGKFGTIQPQPQTPMDPAPMVIGKGRIAFPGRVPAPDTVQALLHALATEDVEELNTLMFEHNLFMAP